ncbi:hypothetical protein [Haloarchaeobius amylolyticus]|uniref:hypothetical protein n=1 Tax=Haloarchaeobius amylolyticus TaxID=1198296 RepID=UPI00226E90EC|nr:hypothetical protein [Haloarchaeobius amylolyticus]
MSAADSPLVTTGFTVVLACLVGTVSGITVVLGPPILTAVIVAVSDVAGNFYAGVFLGVFIGVLVSAFTAFLVYRVYRLQQTHRPQTQSGVMYAPSGGGGGYQQPGSYQQQVTGGDPPLFDMYLVGTVAALLVSLVLGPVLTVAAGIGGALLSARLFAGV